MDSSTFSPPEPVNTAAATPVAATVAARQAAVANTEVIQAGQALSALDTARGAILDWQRGVEARLMAAQTELVDAQKALETTRAEMVQVKKERDQWRDQCDQHQASVSDLSHQLSAHQERIVGQQQELHSQAGRLQEQQSQIDSLQAQRANQEAQLQAHRAEIESHKDEIEARKDEVAARDAQLAQQSERNQKLHTELFDLYQDLRATDLPTLILRVGMNLTGAENGLFVNATSDQTLAAIGLENLPENVLQGLYHYTRKAADQETPVVCNDEQSLPDGQNLVNLAAMPVAVKGNLRGVILVANKRSGPFTEHDTEVLLSIGKHAGIALENHRLHQALNEAYSATIAVLADAIEAKDPYTRGHCENVATIAVKVAERLGLQGEEIDQVRYAALLHDVGKIGIPDGILLKPSRLLPEEFQVIQRHASIGSDLVSRVASLLHIAPTIKHHHERFDGTGYPDGLSGEAILLASRIVGVVDAFDAMTTPRPYRSPVSTEEALAELRRCSGAQFDPNVVETVAAVLLAQSAPPDKVEDAAPSDTEPNSNNSSAS